MLNYRLVRRARVLKSQEQHKQTDKKKIPITSWGFSRGNAVLLHSGNQRAETQQQPQSQYLWNENKLLKAPLPLHGAHFCPPTDTWLQLLDNTYIAC